MNINLIDKLKQNKVLPIIRSNSAQIAYDTARAIIDGGLDIIEITVENPQVFQVIEKLSKDAIICAGGVITSLQAQTAIDSGAKVFSSPIFQTNLVKISKDRQIPFIAGTSTANEAYEAWKSRVPLTKIFPIAALGGVDYVENILRPMPFLNLIPQGNVRLEEIPQYINAGAFAVGIGRALTLGDSFKEVTEKTKNLVNRMR